MQLHNPHTAILSAVIFNALIIVMLIPLALRGVKFQRAGRERDPAAQHLDLRRRRDHRPVRPHQAHRHVAHRAGGALMRAATRSTGLMMTLAMIVLVGLAYPLAMTGIAPRR